MSYQWDLEEKLAEGITRIIDEQIDDALAQLTDEGNDRDEAIHSARKSFKKIRAVLRLVRDQIGDTIYREQNELYRDLGRALAPMRDAYVRVMLINKLIDTLEADHLRSSAETMRAELVADYENTRTTFWQSATTQEVIDRLTDERDTIHDMPLNKKKAFKVFKKGVKRIHKQGQDEMEIAYQNVPSAVEFHQWRKRVKYLWYHLRILKPYNPDTIADLIDQLDQLGDLLGSAHDFAVLYNTLVEHPETQDGAGRHLLALLDQQRGELEQQAYELGEAIYHKRTKHFIKQIKD
ncbi:MAG: CHAD domain-containing protein [Anaerolineae bacterium]